MIDSASEAKLCIFIWLSSFGFARGNEDALLWIRSSYERDGLNGSTGLKAACKGAVSAVYINPRHTNYLLS